jgi:hypothetical protein
MAKNQNLETGKKLIVIFMILKDIVFNAPIDTILIKNKVVKKLTINAELSASRMVIVKAAMMVTSWNKIMEIAF